MLKTRMGLLIVLLVLLLGAPTGWAQGEHLGPRTGWVWPTGGPVQVVRPFDPPAMPWLSGHRGVDLDAPVGSTIVAPANGTVVFAGKVVDRQVLSIMHSQGLRTTYEPVTPLVFAGDTVLVGTPIAVVEEGHSPGNLHWGARFEKNEYVDPLRLLIGPSVLKPWTLS